MWIQNLRDWDVTSRPYTPIKKSSLIITFYSYAWLQFIVWVSLIRISIMPISLTGFQGNEEICQVVGRLLVGYGELEFTLLECLAVALDDEDSALRTFFRLRSEANRADVADALIRPIAIRFGLQSVYEDAITALGLCRSIRNNYAHCHWAYRGAGVVNFVKFEETTKKRDSNNLKLYQLSLELVRKQDDYFEYTLDILNHLHSEIAHQRGHLHPRRRQRPQKVPAVNLHIPSGSH